MNADARSAPSATARKVAAYRLGFERLAAPYGDPAADETLARDIAGEMDDASSEMMTRYLRARTAFFDRVVVNAIERGVDQFVNLGAGYDGRSLRYAKPGVRWWEIDRLGTQADKRARLARLHLDARHIGFVAHDLAERGLAERLIADGYVPDAAGLFICEGVAVYLDTPVLQGLLRDLRALATVGTRLALSLATAPTSDDHSARRERFRARVAALGEPAVDWTSARDADGLLASTRWRAAEISERAQRAGFVVAGPAWTPTSDDQPGTASTVGRFMERMLHRDGTDTLAAHLETAYHVPVTDIHQLDLGVHRVRRADGTVWIARVFPAARRVDAVHADAAILDWLAAQAVPAERCADHRPVSMHHGQAVLVTEFLPGRKAAANQATFAELGRLLSALHQLEPPSALRRAGGAWHHLVDDGGLADHKASAIELLSAARARVHAEDVDAYTMLLAGVEAIDDLVDLPHGFVHPDPVPPNLIATSGGPALIDWAGAGWAPRLASLGCLLWAAAGRGDACVDAAVAGYRSVIRPDPSELSRLDAAMRITPLVLASWSFATGRQTVEQSAGWWTKQSRRINRAARRAHDLFAGP